MGQNLVRLLQSHARALSAFPDSPVTQAMPGMLALSRPLIAEFDERITRLAGGSSPPFPFPSADAYYRWGASDAALPGVRVPLLALNAGDDPIVRALPMPEEAGGNGWVAMCVTAGGGHLGWFEAGERWGEVRRWIRRPVLEWLEAARGIVLEDRSVSKIVERDGWITEEGKEHLGVMPLQGHERVEGAAGEEGMIQGL